MEQLKHLVNSYRSELATFSSELACGTLHHKYLLA